MAAARILIVQDEISTATELENRLTAMGYGVAAIVRSGKEAVEKAARTRPRVILSDVILPGEMDGVEAARIVREQYNIPVIYATQHLGPEFLERAKWTYPLAYLVAPFSDAELRAALEIGLFRHEHDVSLRQSSELFSMTLDVLGGAVIVTDEHGIIQNISSVAEILTGWGNGQALGKHLAEVYVLRDEESGEIVDNPLSIMHMKSEFVPTSSQYTLISRNNVPIPIANTVMSVPDKLGRRSGVIVAFQDSSQMVMPEQFWNSYAANLHLSALLLSAQGHWARAETCFQRALLIWERNLGSDNPKVCRALEGLAKIYENTGKMEEATQLRAKAGAIRAGVPVRSSE